MSYTLTVGYLHLSPSESADTAVAEYDCEQTRHACSPTYVFSVMGQVGFRQALNHLAQCQKQDCRTLRRKVFEGMAGKLKWLWAEAALLGCVQIQPYLYGSRRILLKREQFPYIAHHLSSCPRESCAQLRRALLLSIREKVRPVIVVETPQ